MFILPLCLFVCSCLSPHWLKNKQSQSNPCMEMRKVNKENGGSFDPRILLSAVQGKVLMFVCGGEGGGG